MDVMGKLDRSLDPDELLVQLQSSDWPEDDDIRAKAIARPIYSDLSSRAVAALLRGIEAEQSGSGAMFFPFGSKKGEYTIEHIFPQKHSTWQSDMQAWGADAVAMQHLLHSLGNLAVVTPEHNSAVGNGTFTEKRKYPTKPGKAAPLSINASWLRVRKWTEVQISTREKNLIETALRHWSVP